MGDIVYQDPRAATIHPATLDLLDDLGVYERIEPLGIVCPIVNYYDQHELLASFDHGLSGARPAIRGCCNASRTSCRAPSSPWCSSIPNVEVRTETTVRNCNQSADGVEVEVQTAGGKPERHQGPLSGRRRRRALDRPQGNRRRVRRVHLQRTLHDHRHVLRFLRRPATPIATTFPIRTNGTTCSRFRGKARPACYRLVAPVPAEEALQKARTMLATCQRKLRRFNPRHGAL